MRAPQLLDTGRERVVAHRHPAPDAVEQFLLGDKVIGSATGRRQVVFVTGEPGIGKSSLADAFLEQLLTAHSLKTANASIITGWASPIFL